MDVKEQDSKYFGRGGEAMDLQVTRADGSFIYNSRGEKYIDFLGGAGVGNLGWEKEPIESEIRQEDRPSYVYPHFYYKPWAELAKLLATITPGKLIKSFRTTGGSEAVEAAMQMAMLYTGRKKFLSIEGSYHGNTIATLSLGATSKSEKFSNVLGGCEKIEPPLNEEALKMVEDKLKGNEIAAFIMEPIVVNLGVVIPETVFMNKLQELCKKHGTLLVMDEAITGFGRTGKLFASEHYEIEPDILCMAKAMSAGHAGIGAVITTQEVAEKVEGKIGLYSSYGWHPISVDASITAIKYILKNKEKIFTNLDEISRLFEEELKKIEFGSNAEIRVKGLAIAIDLQDEEKTSKMKQKCFENGLLLNTEKTSLVLLPALNIKKETVKEGLQILKNCAENL